MGKIERAVFLAVILVFLPAAVHAADPVAAPAASEKQPVRSDEALLKQIIAASNNISRAYQTFWWIDPMIQCEVIRGGAYAPPDALKDVEKFLTESLSGLTDVEGESEFLNQYRGVLLKRIPKMLVALKMKGDAIGAYARGESVPADTFAKAQARFELSANKVFDYEAQTAAKTIKEKYPVQYGAFSSDFRRAGDGISLELDPNVSMGFQTWDAGSKIVVGFVCCGSEAAKAGLEVGDEIISLKGGKPFKDKTDYLKSAPVSGAKAGRKIGLVIKRGGKTKTLEFKTEDRRKYEADLRDRYAEAMRRRSGIVTEPSGPAA